jgi:hypothetical protein
MQTNGGLNSCVRGVGLFTLKSPKKGKIDENINRHNFCVS